MKLIITRRPLKIYTTGLAFPKLTIYQGFTVNERFIPFDTISQIRIIAKRKKRSEDIIPCEIKLEIKKCFKNELSFSLLDINDRYIVVNILKQVKNIVVTDIIIVMDISPRT
jgi:hypothetical protein